MELIAWPGTDEWAPAFSHAGQRLAYLSNRGGTTQVWMTDLQRGEPRQITNHPGPEELMYVAWSGDDQTLILTVRDLVRDARLMSVPVQGGMLGEYWPAWSSNPTQAPDDRWAFVTWTGGQTDIYGVSRDGVQYPLAMTIEDEDVPNIDRSGTKVAYNAGTQGARRIQIVPATGGEPMVLPQIGEDDSNPVWSPDGSALAIVSTTNGRDDVWIVPLSDGAPLLVDLPGHEQLWYLTWGG
jgi:Tol biopolymer transport system component